MNDNHADVLLASAASKKKSERLQLISIIAVVFLVILSGLLIFFNSEDNVNSSDGLSEDVQLKIAGNILEENSGENKSHELNKLFQLYRKDIKPALQALPRKTIFGEKAVVIQNQVANLIDNVGDYLVLKTQLNNDINKAKALLIQYGEEVNSSLERLNEAFKAFDANRFERELTNLMALAENNKEVQRWSAQKSKVFEYFKYADKANRAKAELKIELELASLQQIERLGFADPKMLVRIDELKNAVAEQKFAQHIQSANTLLAKAKLKEARDEIIKAAAIFPQRPQVKELRAVISEELKKANVANILITADNYAVLDQWKKAKQSYENAIAIIPSSKLAKDGNQLSKSILDIKAQLEDIANQPLRLKSAEVMKYAEQLLASSAYYTQYSDSLATAHMDVKELVEQKMLPRSVWVESDATANIRVQGVGYIRPTKGKFVDLRPGNYLFYAECKGYKTEMYRVTIPLEDKILPIKVICGNSL